MRPLTEENHDAFAPVTSPDQTRMVYLDCLHAECQYVITTEQGVVTTFPYKEEWLTPSWLDNDRLAIPQDLEPYDSVLEYDLFKGPQKEILLDLPDAYYFQNEYRRMILFAIDPTMTRVVYFDSQDIGREILWDLQAKKILAWLPYPVTDDPPSPGPGFEYEDAWSPDGSRFLIDSPVTQSVEELFSISRDGQVEQLTRLGERYGSVYISLFRWSPDGRKIAFWLQLGESAGLSYGDMIQRLVVLDLATKEVTDTCITVGSPKSPGAITDPVWSPDGRQLAVRVLSKNEKWTALLVDLEKGLAGTIDGDLTPEGWLKAEK